MYGNDNDPFPGGGMVGAKLRAMQMLSLLNNIAQQRDAREYEKIRQQREQTTFENSQADRKRNITIDDFMRDYGMRQAGAIPVSPDAATAAPKITGGAFSGIQMPGGFFKSSIVEDKAAGRAYRVPTEQEKEDRSISKATRLKSIESEINAPQKIAIEIPPALQPKFQGRTQLLVDEDKELQYREFLRKLERGNVQVFHTGQGIGAYDEDVINDRVRRSPTGVVEIPTPGLAAPTAAERNYGEKEKQRAHYQAMVAWKKKYPLGKESPEFLQAVNAYASDEGKTPEVARKEMMQSKRLRDEYGVGDIYIKDPTKDWEYEEERNRALEAGSSGGARVQTTPTKTKTQPRKIGDFVMNGGKKYKVVNVLPSGELELELAQ